MNSRFLKKMSYSQSNLQISDHLFWVIHLNLSLLSSTKISDDLFFSHSPQFGFWSMPKRCKYESRTAPKSFWRPCFRHSLHSLENFSFHPFFDSHTYKITTTTAQFTFYNCKLHFTIAEIVISYMLKYALICCYLCVIFAVVNSVESRIFSRGEYLSQLTAVLPLIYIALLQDTYH